MTTNCRSAAPAARAAGATPPSFPLVLALAAGLLATPAVPVGAAAQTARSAADSAPPLTLPEWETTGDFADLPHPRDVFGFEPGADYSLATHERMLEYFRRLDEASDRVRVEEIGRSVQGRPMILAYISSAENLTRLDRWRETAEALARGRTPEADARRLAAEGKAVVWIDGGLHATEVAGAQHAPLLAWRVAAEESEEMRRIRDDVVLLLMPVMNPDGLDLVADWTAGNRGTPWEGTSPPVLYQFYTGHDNNRDWFMITQPETRAVTDVLYNRWYPQIVYNQHQTAPWPTRIFIPPFADPVNPNIPPLVVRGVNLVGDAMGKRFSEEGKPGAIARVNFDMWWNGGMRTAPYYHNMIGILTETAHASVAPRYVDPADLPSHIGTLPATAPSIFHPDPWQGGWFRLRDAVEYMLTGSMAVLDVASRHREDWLLNMWRMARASVEAGEAGRPFAYVVSPDQRRPGEAVAMVNALRKGGVEVHRATRPFTAAGQSFPAGSFVALAGQAFRPHLVDLMEVHEYPDMRVYPDGPPDTPYDVSGWTLPIQMDVATVRVDEPFEADGLEPVDEARVWPGEVVGRGGWGWATSATPNAAAVAVNRLLAADASVSVASAGVEADGRALEPGAFVVRGAAPDAIRALADELGIDFVALDDAPAGELRPMERSRVGLYKSWMANMDEGWTRWVLEQYEFPVDTLADGDIRTGDLSRYHAIILPDQRGRAILQGHRPGTRPDSLTGGIGEDGMRRLREYAEAGGRLIAFDGAADLLIDQLALPLRNVLEGLPSEEFFVPGTLIRMSVEDHPLARGMGDEAAAFFVRSAAFEVTPTADAGVAGADAAEANGTDASAAEASAHGTNVAAAKTAGSGGAIPADAVEVAARYASDDLVLSGWALGEDRHLAGRAALVRVPIGAGDAVLFAFRPQFRGQPRGTFRLLFNALHGAAER